MSVVSAMNVPAMVATRQHIRRDSAIHADVWRRVSGSEVRVMSLVLRIAAVSSRSVGRDVQIVQGNVSPSFYTAALPVTVGSVLRPDDELWADVVRYRIISVDTHPHEVQILMHSVQ